VRLAQGFEQKACRSGSAGSAKVAERGGSAGALAGLEPARPGRAVVPTLNHDDHHHHNASKTPSGGF
jgi:hypothetical protein